MGRTKDHVLNRDGKGRPGPVRAWRSREAPARPLRPHPASARQAPGRPPPEGGAGGAHLLAAPAPVALRRGGRGAGEGRRAEAATAATAPRPAGRPRAGAPAARAAPARAVVAEDLPLRALLPHGGRCGLADAAGGLQAQWHRGRLGRPPRAQRHGNGDRRLSAARWPARHSQRQKERLGAAPSCPPWNQAAAAAPWRQEARSARSTRSTSRTSPQLPRRREAGPGRGLAWEESGALAWGGFRRCAWPAPRPARLTGSAPPGTPGTENGSRNFRS